MRKNGIRLSSTSLYTVLWQTKQISQFFDREGLVLRTQPFGKGHSLRPRKSGIPAGIKALISSKCHGRKYWVSSDFVVGRFNVRNTSQSKKGPRTPSVTRAAMGHKHGVSEAFLNCSQGAQVLYRRAWKTGLVVGTTPTSPSLRPSKQRTRSPRSLKGFRF